MAGILDRVDYSIELNKNSFNRESANILAGGRNDEAQLILLGGSISTKRGCSEKRKKRIDSNLWELLSVYLYDVSFTQI